MNYDPVSKQWKMKKHVFIFLDMKCSQFHNMFYCVETFVCLPASISQEMIEVMTSCRKVNYRILERVSSVSNSQYLLRPGVVLLPPCICTSLFQVWLVACLGRALQSGYPVACICEISMTASSAGVCLCRKDKTNVCVFSICRIPEHLLS